MKKFTFKGVLDGFRSSTVNQTSSLGAARNITEQEIQETLRPEHFHLRKTFRHGFPYSPTALAYDTVQKVLAIGDKSGSMRILGKFGVDAHVTHEGESRCAVNLIEFLVNEGGIVTATADDTLHLWDFHTKIPKVVQSLKFQRERITHLHLPVGTKWLYVGTEKGNTHIVHADSFTLSGYVINWNKAIDPIRKTHPGAVIHLSDNPLDANKLLIGFETGQLVLWDMRGKCAELRWISQEPLLSCTWHHEGKHFISSHTDGSLCTWPLKLSPKPLVHGFPHAKTNKDGKTESCNAIKKVEVKTNRLGEQFTIFSGGLPTEKCSNKSHCITVLVQGKSTTVLEMEHPVIDFITICESPWESDLQEPYAVAVLLQNDLVLIDLLTPGYPTFESPYSMDLHESQVTCCTYLADCPSDLVPALYSVGRNTSNRRSGYSEREWPINGGEWQPTSCSYSEIVMTGHYDGSIKFWDSSAGTLQVLYKLKTSKIFEKSRVRSMDANDDDSLSISAIALCAESRKLCIATSTGHVVLFKFRRAESTGDIAVLEIPISYDGSSENEGNPECEFIPKTLPKQTADAAESEKCNGMLKVRSGPQRKPAGFQAQLICVTPWTLGTHPGQITALTINSSYGLMAYGNEYGLAVVDIVQKKCLLNLSTQEMYVSLELFARTPKSPKKLESTQSREDNIRSPSIDQRLNDLGDVNKYIDVEDYPSISNLEESRTTADRNFVPDEFPNTSCVLSNTEHRHSECNTLNSANSALPVHRKKLAKKQSEGRASFVKNLLDVFQGQEWGFNCNKLDNSVSRSRSSSLSSLENVNTEAVTCLAFADSYIKKSDPSLALPTMWLGTSLGAVLTISLVIPEQDVRKSAHVEAALTGLLFRLKGSVLSMSLLDCNGALIPYSFESWKDDGKEGKDKRDRTPTKTTTNRTSPTNPDALCDRQFIVIATEKQAGVFALPSQNCVHKKRITEFDFVVKAEIISMKDSVCLICYASNGHLLVFTLPSLKPLLDIDFLPLSDLSISKTFSFSNKGHGLYLVTPTEIQKFTVCHDFCNQYSDMLGELYSTHEMPEVPKESFFKGLFGGGMRSLDREELFGESSGKANKSVAKHIPGSSGNIQELNTRTISATSEVGRAHQLMLERGDKLGQLEERTERMASEAQQFSNSAHLLMNKYKDKKWYQL